MVKVLIGNKNIDEINILCQKLANDKVFKIRSVTTGKETINTYWKYNPDILILDNKLPDMETEDILDRLSCSPIEKKRCNVILTVSSNYNTLNLCNVAKLNKIVKKPVKHNELLNIIEQLAIDYNTPDIEVGEIEWLLQFLNFNCMSPRL